MFIRQSEIADLASGPAKFDVAGSGHANAFQQAHLAIHLKAEIRDVGRLIRPERGHPAQIDICRQLY